MCGQSTVCFRGLTYFIVVSPISEWNVLGITSLNSVFASITSGCTDIDLSGWNTSNVQSMVSLVRIMMVLSFPISFCTISCMSVYKWHSFDTMLTICPFPPCSVSFSIARSKVTRPSMGTYPPGMSQASQPWWVHGVSWLLNLSPFQEFLWHTSWRCADYLFCVSKSSPIWREKHSGVHRPSMV